ncbi:hypothetical protein KM043_005122 [Ampulex compressa]|nr:hypothetical protein KM043_005122 [Ampulex compressa]
MIPAEYDFSSFENQQIIDGSTDHDKPHSLSAAVHLLDQLITRICIPPITEVNHEQGTAVRGTSFGCNDRQR